MVPNGDVTRGSGDARDDDDPDDDEGGEAPRDDPLGHQIPTFVARLRPNRMTASPAMSAIAHVVASDSASCSSLERS
jgi:hypothetical protein